MTTEDPKDQPNPPATPDPGGFREGIYLEQKKSSIGTGSTAKTAEYHTFWATGRVMADSVIMVLLNDEFKPTTIQETFPLETMTEPRWFYIVEGEKKYQYLRPVLDRLLEAPPAAAPKAAAPAKTSNWWEGGASDDPPANPFELKKDKKQTSAPPKKGGWWEK